MLQSLNIFTMSQHSFFPLVLSLSFFFMNSNGNGVDQIPTNCPSKLCGGVNISYPFWVHDNTNSDHYCGYRGFNVSCSGSGSAESKPTLLLSNYTYNVTDIYYSSDSLTLVDMDVTTNPTCPRAHHNLTLDGTVPLSYSDLDQNLTFYFNCTSDGPFFGLLPIDCLGSSVNGSYVYLAVEEPEAEGVVHWQNYCEKKVVATVMEREIINEFDLNIVFGWVVNKGFVLNWTMPEDCGECEESDGRCGYNNAAQRLVCFCSDGSMRNGHCRDEKSNMVLKLAIGASAAGISWIFMTLIIFCCFRSRTSSYKSIKFWQKKTNDDNIIEACIKQNGSLAPKRYNYSEVKKMTNFFRDKLGQGGYGGVYRGKLFDGRPVAVKILNGSKGNGEEFINEVSSISRTSHVNIVSLLGFCFDSHDKRALIYELMPNGSLEKFIYSEGPLKASGQLGWEKLYQIAIGIARGLEYLHRGCNTRILHFDIKPHNILLDEDFCPKISDFGLAKLCPKKDSIISMLGARGTIGYIAPEVFSRNFGGVSHKSDVYSYGMMILEMVGGRKNIDVGVGHTSEIYFPHWIYKRLELDEDLGLQGDMNKEENEIARKMIIVGLWCIQTEPSQRPSISTVMDMLEGSMEALEIPPKPFLCSPSRPVVNSSTISIT